MSHLQKSKHKDAEISKLQAALRLFINNKASQEPVEVDKDQDELIHSGGEDEEMDVDADAEKDDEPLKPLFDDNTGLYFCTDCLAEIEEGFCVLCGDKYEWQEVSIFSMYLQWPRNKAYLNRKTLCGTQRARKIRPFTTIVV